MVVATAASSRYCAITSPATPPAILPFLPSSYSLAEVAGLLATVEVGVLIDATFDEVATTRLAVLSQELHIPLLVLGPTERYQSDWVFYLGVSFDLLARAMDEALRCLGFLSVSVFGDVSSYSLRLGAALRSLKSSVDYDFLIVSPNESLETYVGTVLRPKGKRMTVFTTLPSNTKEILKAQYRMHIGGAGYANLMSAYSSFFAVDLEDTENNLVTGNLVIIERKEVAMVSDEDWAKWLYAVISPFLSLTSSNARNTLEIAFPSHIRDQDYVLMNMQNGTRVKVDQIATCVYDRPIYYLSNATNISLTSSAPIQISGNFGQTDVAAGYMGTDTIIAAALLAIAEINDKEDLVPHFTIQVWNFSVGVLTYQPKSFQREVLPQKAQLGAAIISNIGSFSTMSLITDLRNHTISTPVVAAINSNSALSSQTRFPNFIRLCLSDDYLNLVIVQTIKHLGWTKCALLVVDSDSGLAARKVFQHLLPNSGIEIVNDPSSQVIAAFPASLEEARANFTAAFQQIIDTKCRIVVVISLVIWKLVPLVLYDLGMRRGDLVIVGRGWTAPLNFEDLNEEEITHAAEIMYGSIQFSPDIFVGPIGESFKQKYSQVVHLPPTSYSCLYYDTAYTIGHALDWLLEVGKDFVNSADMIKALRGVRFKGCSGLVYFEINTNDRQSMRYTLNTIMQNASTGLFLQEIGVYDPTGTVLLRLNENFVWGDGITKIPSNMRESSLGCPFEDRLNQQFKHGFLALMGACMAFFIFAVAVGALAWVHCRIPLEPLIEERELDSEDALEIAAIPIDLLQSLGLGADLSFVHPNFQHLLSSAAGDFFSLEDLKDGRYFSLWIVAASLLSASLLLAIPLHCISLCKQGNGLARTLLDLWLYVFVHWFFIPILLILLNSFSCTKSVAQSAQDVSFANSYLTADCYVTCWTSNHIIYVCLSIVLLLIYSAGNVYYRPIRQASSDCLNVQTESVFLCFTPAFQILLVSLCIILRKKYPLLHAALFCALFSLQLIYSILRPKYGYKVMSIRQVVAILAVIWSSLIAICQLLISNLNSVFGLLLVIGDFLILLFGEIYMHLRVPILLRRKRGIDTFYLFKFAFKPVTSVIAVNLQREFQLTMNRCVLRREQIHNFETEGRTFNINTRQLGISPISS